MDSGGHVAFGSDWYVAPASPIEAIYAAVTRKTKKHPDGFYPEERITVEQALKAYTCTASFAGFTEKSLGELKKDYLADFVVLDKDLFTIEHSQILETQVLYTVVGGKIVYSSER